MVAREKELHRKYRNKFAAKTTKPLPVVILVALLREQIADFLFIPEKALTNLKL